MMRALWILVGALSVPALLACSDGGDELGRARGTGRRGAGAGGGGEDEAAGGAGTGAGGGAGTDTGTQVQVQACAAAQRKYTGLGGADLTQGRAMALATDDRYRVKPYSALGGEVQRVFGTTPPSYAAAADSFGAPPERWYTEALGSAVTLYTTYRIAFDAAMTYTADAKYSAAPTDATAGTECAAFIRKAWSRTGTPAEIDACKKLAVSGSAAETDAKRKWAHAFASVATASGFTTY